MITGKKLKTLVFTSIYCVGHFLMVQDLVNIRDFYCSIKKRPRETAGFK